MEKSKNRGSASPENQKLLLKGFAAFALVILAARCAKYAITAIGIMKPAEVASRKLAVRNLLVTDAVG